MLYFLDSQLSWLPGECQRASYGGAHMPEWVSRAGIHGPSLSLAERKD